MPQFKVPQNLDMEDRIIGHLTLIQFGYLALFGMIAYVVLIKLPGMFGIILAIIIAIFGFALAVVKVQDQPLPKFLLSLIRYLLLPRERAWHHENVASGSLIKRDAPKAVVKKTAKKVYSKEEIGKIAESVDSHGYASVDDNEQS